MKKSFYIKTAFLCEPLANVNIDLVDSSGKVLNTIKSDPKGFFEIQNILNIDHIIVEKAGFNKKKISLTDNPPTVIRLLEDHIIGYQNSLSFTPGEKVKAFINSSSEYKAVLVRHGKINKQVLELGEFPSCIQQIPDDFFVKDGLTWNISLEYTIPDSSIPGLYSLNLIPKNNEAEPYFITFVVSTRPAEYGKKSKLLVLVSSNNWQTYNIWGGRSRYRNFEYLIPVNKNDTLRSLWIKYVPESIKNRAKKILRKKFPITIDDEPTNIQFQRLSVNRPHPNCSIEDDDPHKPFTSHLAASEWRLLAWLEQNNFDYDIVSGFVLHQTPELLKNYKTFILSSHSEYWSKEMYKGLKDFFYRGGSILNLSGNSIYREIEFFKDGSLRCVSLRLTETVADESELIGVRFDMRGYGTCAPYRVLEPDHWVFEGMNLSKDDLFAQVCLNQPTPDSQRKFETNPASSPGLTKLTGIGGSGWETDKLTDTAPKDIKIIAKGANRSRGGADMIIREKSSEHGFLFSASSITFAGSLLVDKVSSGIVRNVLERIINE